MPVKLDEPRHYDWNVPRADSGAQKYYQDLYQKTPFVILDASTAPSDFGETALFLCAPSDADGHITGDPFVMALGASGRDRYIEQAQAVADEHHHEDGIGPLVIEMVDTDKGNPFPAFRKFTGSPAGSRTNRTTAQAKKSKASSTDEIPF
jgi:hypothetical protein